MTPESVNQLDSHPLLARSYPQAYPQAPGQALPLDSATPPGPITPYVGNYVSLPAAMLKPPVEGNRTVPISILWIRDGQSPGNTVEFNAQSQRVTPISQIASLYIDNSANPSNVAVIFPDTNFQITAPANSLGYYPVISNGVRFYAFNELIPGTHDHTIIQVLNFLPPALAIASGPPQGTGLGTVTEVDTLSPLQGGPITTQGTVSINNAALLNLIESYPDLHMSGSFEVNGTTSLSTLHTSGQIIENFNLAAPQPPPAAGGAAIQINGPDASPSRLVIDAWAANPAIWMRRGDGSGGTPTVPVAGEVLGQVVVNGWQAGGFGTTFTGALQFKSEETTWSATAHGTQIEMATTPIGSTTPQSSLVLDPSGNLTILGSVATKPGSTAWANPSSPELKCNTNEYTSGLEVILGLQPIEYEYNGTANLPTGQTFYGLDATATEKVMPEIVGEGLWRDPATGNVIEFQTIDPSALIFALVNAVKELEAKVKRLERGSIVVGARGRK